MFDNNVFLSLCLGVSLGTVEPEAPPTPSPSPHALGDLIHAALLRKEYLGHALMDTGNSLTGITRALGYVL